MDEIPLFSYLFSAPLVRANSDGSCTDIDILDYLTERRELKLLLDKKAGGNIRWKSEVANVNNFLNAYSNSKILHFTGHGEHGVMAFEDKHGKLKFISQTELSEMCQELTDKPECVFLSACFAQTVADAFVNAGIKHIVTVTNDRVLDKANLEFTDSFYSALISGKSVLESFNLGVARLVAHYPTERLKFDLKGDGDHTEVIFSTSDILSQRSLIDETPPLPLSQCSSPAPFFIGRHTEVQQVYELLRNDMKMINITGQRGIGKTEVALRVAEYARERYSFSRLLYVELDKISNCSEKACLEKLTYSFNIAPSSVFDIISHIDVESAVEVIRGSVRPEEKVFLILDGVDQWLRKKREFLLSLVERLRQRLGDVLWIVLTSQQYIALDACREVVIDGLSDVHAAQLFVVRAPRSLDRDELTLEANEAHKDPILAFARTKLLQSMKGNPRVIGLVAKELQYDGQPQNMMRYETFFREEIIPSILAQVLFFSTDLPTWQDVCARLRNIYRRTVGIEACRARPLTLDDFDFFAQCTAWGGDDCIPSKNRYVVVPSSLDAFLGWFEGILVCLKCSGLWSRPHCIFGFIDRIRAAEILKDSEPGTFLIGVSQGEPCLVINAVQSVGRVLPVKVKVDPASPAPFSMPVKHGMTNCFMTLEDLLISNPQLQYFYPSFPVDGGPISKLTLLPQN